MPGSRLASVISVLVVDDQDPFRRAARFVLERTERFTCVGEAATGEQAVRMAGELQPDLVLMDVKLPGIDGTEATRRIRAARPETVVFLCSTYDPADLPPLDCGATTYIHKEELTAQLLEEQWERAVTK